jgi:shikimate kinase
MGDERHGAVCRVAVAGFMAAGKTTTARELARILSCAFIDLDELVTEREGRTPQELIDAEGEARFRELETDALRAALARSDAFVIALGGGTWTLERNRALVRAADCHAVWLDAPFELCWDRIERDASLLARPLARDRDAARRLYDERLASYHLAQLHLPAGEGFTAVRLAQDIAAALRDGAPKD